MDEDIQWICPICQSTEYVKRNNIDFNEQSHRCIKFYYECNGCSIHFGDLEKFNAISIISEVADELLDKCL